MDHSSPDTFRTLFGAYCISSLPKDQSSRITCLVWDIALARLSTFGQIPGAGFAVGTRLTFAGSNAHNYFSRGRWIFERRALTLTGTEPSIEIGRSGCRSSLGSKFAR
jgi:hypothetical protein